MTITIKIDDIVEYRPDTGRRTPPQPRQVSRRIGIRYWPEGGPEARQSGGVRLYGKTKEEADTLTLETIISMLKEAWPDVQT